MHSNTELENKLRQLKPTLAEKFNVSSIGYFGSYSNGSQTNDSDLDLIVEFSKPVGWNFFKLDKYLEIALGLKIDLVTSNSLKDRIRESILNQVRYI